MKTLQFKNDTDFKVIVKKKEIFAGVQTVKKPVYKDFYELHIKNKLHSKHCSFESICQVIYKLTNGKYGIITKDDYEEI